MSLTPPRQSDPRRGTGVGLSIAVMTAANVLNNRWLTRTYVPNSIVTTIVLLAHARRHGLSWDELGVARPARRTGLVWAAASVASVATVYSIGLAVPATRRAFVDRRARDSAAGVAFQALVPVLFGTVLLEEAAFRGVLWGLLRRRYGVGPATAISSVLFGLWHILPSREMARHNPAISDVTTRASGTTTKLVLSSIAFTTTAGVLLAELRRRSGSLIAPAGLHWATNGLGYLCAAVARRLP